MIAGTAGHVDHGKTSLVRALTGIETDRLKEEKARGITIEPGFAHWARPGGKTISFVDMPGHERFLPAMLAGASAIDFLLLVVAADDGVMPQTVEHVAVARFLGIARGAVALTKIDLADAAARLRAGAGIAALLAGTAFAASPVFPLSAATGEGIAALAAHLDAALADDVPAIGQGLFRMSVDRAFSVPGAGTVVTGTARAGRIAVGDRVAVLPAGGGFRVRGLRVAGKAAPVAAAGERVAVNLADVGLDGVSRGDTLADPASAPAVTRFDAVVEGLAPDWPPPRGATGLRLHAGTAETGLRLQVLGRSPSGAAFVHAVADGPVALLAGERFILRHAASRRVIGGGVTLDLSPPSRGRTAPERVRTLAALARAAGPAGQLSAIVDHAPHAVPLARFAAERGLAAADAPALAARAGALPLGEGRDPILIGAGALVTARREALAALARFHEAEPEKPGLAVARLRLLVRPRLERDAFAAVVEDLRRRGDIAAAGAFLRLPGHAPALSPTHEALWRRVRPCIDGGSLLHPPTLADLAATLRERPEAVRGLLKRLARRGDVIEIAPDRFFLAEAVARMAEPVRSFGKEPFTAAMYRDRLGGGRKIAILALEFFDRHGFTIRNGDMRMLNPQRSRLFRLAP
jgi:selenocysteine-specific elongation factor